jgi:hypothetical protein
MKATIWINRDNEQFWVNLENKSGWVNAIIEMLIEEDKKRREQKDEVYVKYGRKYGTEQSDEVQV